MYMGGKEDCFFNRIQAFFILNIVVIKLLILKFENKNLSKCMEFLKK